MLFKKKQADPLSKKLMNLAVGSSPVNFKKTYSQRDLIAKESAIGRHLFGPIPKGNQREFFCLDENTWIWYESWTDIQTNKRLECTTRYEIHPDRILKIQDGQPYQDVTGQELRNLMIAVRQYLLRTSKEVYATPYVDAPAPLQ
jgi:hypothetical protein